MNNRLLGRMVLRMRPMTEDEEDRLEFPHVGNPRMVLELDNGELLWFTEYGLFRP